MNLIELVIDENDNMSGIDAISLVENPAIELDFVALKKQPKQIELAEVSKERRILMGPALVPQKPIYRREGKEEYYIFFSKDTVNKASQLYLKNGYQSNSTLEHEAPISGVTVVESWIVENPKIDKSALHGFDLQEGTWMVSLKVDDDKIWDEFVKTGAVKGFSIEGAFADKVIMSRRSKFKKELISLLKM